MPWKLASPAHRQLWCWLCNWENVIKRRSLVDDEKLLHVTVLFQSKCWKSSVMTAGCLQGQGDRLWQSAGPSFHLVDWFFDDDTSTEDLLHIYLSHYGQLCRFWSRCPASLLLMAWTPEALSGDDDVWPRPPPPHSWDLWGPSESAPTAKHGKPWRRGRYGSLPLRPGWRWGWSRWLENLGSSWRYQPYPANIYGEPLESGLGRSKRFFVRYYLQGFHVEVSEWQPQPSDAPGLWVELCLRPATVGIYNIEADTKWTPFRRWYF